MRLPYFYCSLTGKRPIRINSVEVPRLRWSVFVVCCFWRWSGHCCCHVTASRGLLFLTVIGPDTSTWRPSCRTPPGAARARGSVVAGRSPFRTCHRQSMSRCAEWITSELHSMWSESSVIAASPSLALSSGADLRGWLGWLVTPSPPARQPISYYYYVCDLSYFDVVLWPSSSQILAISFSRKHRPPQCSLASLARVPKVTPL